jgi:hypothetical protein
MVRNAAPVIAGSEAARQSHKIRRKKLPVTFFTYKMKKKFVFLYEMLMEKLTLDKLPHKILAKLDLDTVFMSSRAVIVKEV